MSGHLWRRCWTSGSNKKESLDSVKWLSWDSSLGIVTWLRVERLRDRSSIPRGDKEFPRLHTTTHPPIQLALRVRISAVIRQSSWPSHPSNTGIRMRGVTPPFLHTSSWRGDKCRDDIKSVLMGCRTNAHTYLVFLTKFTSHSCSLSADTSGVVVSLEINTYCHMGFFMADISDDPSGPPFLAHIPFFLMKVGMLMSRGAQNLLGSAYYLCVNMELA
jgi:hypothetical protein